MTLTFCATVKGPISAQSTRLTPLDNAGEASPCTIHGRYKWRALSCKWRWQTTSALGGDWDSGGGCQGSENETATPLQPLDRMKKERETGVAGCLREGGSSTWGQNGRHKPPSSSSQRQGDTGATVPIEVFVSQALSCFSSANRGYNEGGMLPSPRAKGCQYWTYQTLNGQISLPMKIKSMTCFPWLSSLWSGWQL